MMRNLAEAMYQRQQAIEDAFWLCAINVVAWVAGTTLLSIEFGWKIGCGVALLVLFHKQPDRV